MKASLAFITGIIMASFIRTDPHTILLLCGAGILLLIVVRRNDFFGSLCALAVMSLAGLFAGNVNTHLSKSLDIPHEMINATVCIERHVTADTITVAYYDHLTADRDSTLVYATALYQEPASTITGVNKRY